MRMLIVVNNFWPEIGSAAHIYFDLARVLVRRGHEVDIITSYPRKFNLAEKDKSKVFPSEETIDGIAIHRTKHLSLRDNMIFRGCEHFICPFYYLKTYLGLKKKFDVCLVYIPPLPLYYFARMIKFLDGTPSVLNYQDFHPQELADVGVLKNKVLIRLMEYIERQSYRDADFITVLSEGGIDYIINRGGDPSKIAHIYNGCIVSDLRATSTRKDFKERVGISNKVLVSYAGILSPFQGLDCVLDMAKALKKHEDLIFYLVGDGMIKEYLEHRIIDENISNVRLSPLQPKDEYFNIIESSDISLISLDNRMKAPCIPGKLINLMSRGQPIIAVVPSGSETDKLISKAKCGIVVKPDDIVGLKESVLYLKRDLNIRKTLGENGRYFLEHNMDLSKNVMTYEAIFSKLVK